MIHEEMINAEQEESGKAHDLKLLNVLMKCIEEVIEEGNLFDNDEDNDDESDDDNDKYNLILNVFDVVSIIYDKYKPEGRKSFPKLYYPFVFKQILIILGKVEYSKYIPQLKTHSKQKELE